MGNKRSLVIFLSLCLGIFSATIAFTQVTISADRTATVRLGTEFAGGGTATILSGVTVGPSGNPPYYAVEVNELGWTVANYGSLLADWDDGVHFLTEGTLNNWGTIDSDLVHGVAAVLSAQSTAMTLSNEAAGTIQGDSSGVYFDLDFSIITTNAITNQGTISGGSSGVFVQFGDTTLINSGTIEGLGAEGVILGGPGDPYDYTLINSGTIIGNDMANNLTVSMGAGDDTVTLKTGTNIINGGIDADAGTDILNLFESGVVTWKNERFEVLNKDSIGVWTLETDLDLGGTGTSRILDGELRLDNITLMSSTFQIDLPGTLSGNGTIDGSITNDGLITLDSGSGNPFGTFAVQTGDVAFVGAGNTMAVDIGAQVTGDLLDVQNGTATGTGTIQVNEVTAIPDGGTVTVITTNALRTVTFGAGPLPLKPGLTSFIVQFWPQYNANDFTITTTRTPYSNFSTSDNQRQVAKALYDSVGLSTGDLGRVLAHLDFLPLQDLQNAFEELQPKAYAIHPSLVLQEADFFSSNVAGRLRDRRQESIDSASPGGAQPENTSDPVTQERFIADPLDYTTDISEPVSLSAEQSRWRIYAQTYARWSEAKADESIEGFDAVTFGTFFGTDRYIGQSLIGGICLGIGVTDIGTSNAESNGSKLSLRFGPYFSYFRDGFVLEGSVTGSANWFGNRRSIDITGLSRAAEGSYDSYDLAAELATLYQLKFWGFTLAPELRLMYDYIYLNDFQETGADSINLVVFDRQIHSLNHRLGGRLGYDIKFAKSSLRPEAWFGWTHKYFDDEQVVRAGLAGAPQNDFTISTPGIPRDTLHWGAGIKLSLATVVSSYLRYQAEIYQDVWNQSIRGGFRIQF